MTFAHCSLISIYFSGFFFFCWLPLLSPFCVHSMAHNSCLFSFSLSIHFPSIKWHSLINNTIIGTLCLFWIQSSGLFDCPHLNGHFSSLLLLHLYPSFKIQPFLLSSFFSGFLQLLLFGIINLVINDLLYYAFVSYMYVLPFPLYRKLLEE